MEVQGLFDTLAGYLDFLMDLILLHGMEKYARLGIVRPNFRGFDRCGRWEWRKCWDRGGAARNVVLNDQLFRAQID